MGRNETMAERMARHDRTLTGWEMEKFIEHHQEFAGSRQVGSHWIAESRNGHSVPVPVHGHGNQPIPVGTQNGIRRLMILAGFLIMMWCLLSGQAAIILGGLAK